MSVQSSDLPRIHQPEAGDARSLSDRAYYTIRELIVSLELPPGSVVSERDLMQRLGLGRTPVREALRDLARDSLIEVFPRRGMFVSSVDVGDIAGLSEVRLVLEPAAARLAAERSTEADQEQTLAFLAELERTGAPDVRTLIELDQRIHRHIYRCSHNVFLESTLAEYYMLALRIWFLALERVSERLDTAVHEHRAVLEAIRDRDAMRAEAEMRTHIQSFDTAVRAVL